MLSSWCLGPSRGRGAGGRSSEHLPPSESEGGLLTSIWKDRPHVLSSGTSPPAPPRFRAEPRGQSGCRQLSGRQDGGCVWAGWGRRGWGFLWVAVVLCSCQRHGQDPPSSANLPSGSPDLPPAISLLGQNPAIWALGAPPIPIGAETPEGPHRDARGSPRAQPARLGAPGLTRVRRGELILLFINLGEPNSPSRSQAGFAAIWKLLAYFPVSADAPGGGNAVHGMQKWARGEAVPAGEGTGPRARWERHAWWPEGQLRRQISLGSCLMCRHGEDGQLFQNLPCGAPGLILGLLLRPRASFPRTPQAFPTRGGLPWAVAFV